MKLFENLTLDGERALYGIRNSTVQNCIFSGTADGESALKETFGLIVSDCRFDLRYPLWHSNNTKVQNSSMTSTCRAPVWYCNNFVMDGCSVKGVKAVREVDDILIVGCDIDSEEFGWRSNNINIVNSTINAIYAFFESKNLKANRLNFSGKYSFQYVDNAEFENCIFNTKDAFWHAKNVTVRNSVVNGEYLGWYSQNLTLIDCQIAGTQPLCYAENLKIVNCSMVNCDLCFEHSIVDVDVNSTIDSIKNAIGKIKSRGIGDIISDEFKKGEVLLEIQK